MKLSKNIIVHILLAKSCIPCDILKCLILYEYFLGCADGRHEHLMNVTACTGKLRPVGEVCVDSSINKSIGYFNKNYTNVIAAEEYLK